MRQAGSEFQKNCVRLCEDLLQSVPGLRFSNFMLIEDSYFKISVSSSQRYLQIFIYEDEAGYQLDGIHWMGFDRTLYANEDALMSAFREALRGTLFTLAL